MHTFYLPDAVEGTVILPEDESKHCVRVLRMEAGQKLLITNGKGMLFDAILLDAHAKRAVIQLNKAQKGYDHWSFKLQIAIAPTKNIERLEWFLEKATEIGIDEVSLFTSFHSERRNVNPERLEKVIVAAMKQSLKSRLPQLNVALSFEKLIQQPFEGQKFIAWIDETVNKTLTESYVVGSNVLIFIGPEGDFSKEEIALAIANGFVPISLGSARLRTETAALVSCHTIQLLNQLKK